MIRDFKLNSKEILLIIDNDYNLSEWRRLFTTVHEHKISKAITNKDISLDYSNDSIRCYTDEELVYYDIKAICRQLELLNVSSTLICKILLEACTILQHENALLTYYNGQPTCEIMFADHKISLLPLSLELSNDNSTEKKKFISELQNDSVFSKNSISLNKHCITITTLVVKQDMNGIIKEILSIMNKYNLIEKSLISDIHDKIIKLILQNHAIYELNSLQRVVKMPKFMNIKKNVNLAKDAMSIYNKIISDSHPDSNEVSATSIIKHAVADSAKFEQAPPLIKRGISIINRYFD